uniref:CSON010072 protein n=1 Tax=Culicoides sonorensis TaxID=179676 RepID=A0A336N365_CULSO
MLLDREAGFIELWCMEMEKNHKEIKNNKKNHCLDIRSPMKAVQMLNRVEILSVI